MANNNKEETIEKQLWKAADKLRKNIDAAEYKHIVLGLIFLKYISDAFEDHHAKLEKGEGEFSGADPEDRDEYKAENIFFVPPSARWSYLQKRAKLPEIGKDVDAAMDAIERDNASLKDVLPKVFARGNLDPASLGGLIDLISNVSMTQGNASTTLRQAQSASSAANNYKDVRGFCNSASVESVKELDYVLTPGRYVGLPDDEDDFDFNERFTTLKAEFEEQLKEEERLNKLINENLERIEISS